MTLLILGVALRGHANHVGDFIQSLPTPRASATRLI